MLNLAAIAEKWPTGCGTLFYPLVRPSLRPSSCGHPASSTCSGRRPRAGAVWQSRSQKRISIADDDDDATRRLTQFRQTERDRTRSPFQPSVRRPSPRELCNGERGQKEDERAEVKRIARPLPRRRVCMYVREGEVMTRCVAFHSDTVYSVEEWFCNGARAIKVSYLRQERGPGCGCGRSKSTQGENAKISLLLASSHVLACLVGKRYRSIQILQRVTTFVEKVEAGI